MKEKLGRNRCGTGITLETGSGKENETGILLRFGETQMWNWSSGLTWN